MTAPIQTPAGFAPAYAIGFSSPAQTLQVASDETPLPVALASPVAPPPLAGSSGIAVVAGPFYAVPGRPVILTLSGEWTGSVSITRSTDGGLTRHALTVGGAPWGRFTGNACEPVWEETDPAATLHLELAPASGTITYRLGH